MGRFSSTLIAIFIHCLVFGQNNTDYDLGTSFFQKKEYEKAQFYFEKIYKSQPTDAIYQKLFVCYFQRELYKEAEKLVKKQQKIFPKRTKYFVDKGTVYDKIGNTKKSNQAYDEAIKLLPPDPFQIKDLASYFVKKKLLVYAEKAYLRGRKVLRNPAKFGVELGQIYFQQGRSDEMLGAYLNSLTNDPRLLTEIQNALQTNLYDDDGTLKKKIKQELITRIQKNPQYTVLSELLIWYYLQEQEYSKALRQAIAIDKRQKEVGSRVYSIGEIALQNKKYDAAISAFTYLVNEKESSSYYFRSSKVMLLQTYEQKVLEGGDFTQEDIQALDDEYNQTIRVLGKRAESFDVLYGRAYLKAFYANDYEESVQMLKEIQGIKNVKPKDLAKTKIALADVYMLKGEIWESSLLYGQVEKLYKQDYLGEIAKFKSAKVQFYTGDFIWAKTLLDALKASTSKLMANDAMELSILISDNLAADTATEALSLYASADLLAFQNQDSNALILLDSILRFYPENEIVDDVIWRISKIHKENKAFLKQEERLNYLIENYTESILLDNALYSLAEIYEKSDDTMDKAYDMYKKVVFDHPDSIFVHQARKRYREIRKKMKKTNKIAQ